MVPDLRLVLLDDLLQLLVLLFRPVTPHRTVIVVRRELEVADLLLDLLREGLEDVLDDRDEPYQIVVILQLLFNKLQVVLILYEVFQEKENLNKWTRDLRLRAAPSGASLRVSR